MNDGTRRGFVDLVYSALVVGVIAYLTRPQIREALDRRRAEIDAKRAEIEARIERERKGREYLDAIRETIIREEVDADPFYGMEP